MAEKTLNTRIQQKIDTEANWSHATFESKRGEIYFYDKDSEHDYVRMKVGDGEKTVCQLPFVSNGSQNIYTQLQQPKNAVEGDVWIDIDESYSGNTIWTRLPDEYQEVEYLKSTGAQYIDTGVSASTTIITEVRCRSYVGNKCIVGGGDSSTIRYQIYAATDGLYSITLDGKSVLTDVPITQWANIRVDPIAKIMTINDAIYELPYTGSLDNNTLWIFGRNQDSNAARYYSTTDLSYCKIWDGQTLVRHYVPCYRKSDNVSGLYELVNNQFFESATSTSFSNEPLLNDGRPTLKVKKNDKWYYIDIPQDTDTTYDLTASKNSNNENVTINLTARGSGSGTDSVTIKGSGATTVTTDADGVITVNSPVAITNDEIDTICGTTIYSTDEVTL